MQKTQSGALRVGTAAESEHAHIKSSSKHFAALQLRSKILIEISPTDPNRQRGIVPTTYVSSAVPSISAAFRMFSPIMMSLQIQRSV
jgi:hypothetical protein